MTSTHSFRGILSALFGFLCLFASAALAIDDSIDNIQNDLISWVRSKGGSISDKIEIRRVDPTDPTSYMGVFVREPIETKERLFVIPRDCYIHVFDTAAEMDQDDENIEAAYQSNLCQLATKLMGEMKLGTKSEYAPYIAYLKTQTPGQLPANWSARGKELLRRVAVPGSPMVDWIDWTFKGEKYDCIGVKPGSESGISFEEHMVEMTIQRCYDTALIPIWDMVNHDNGKINTENDSMYEEGGLRVRAARKLDAGEELYASYDKCLDCQGVEEYWGTPEILKDFGFVENHPHRWVFTDYGIWIEVYPDYEFDVYFAGDSDHESVPTEQQLEFMKQELTRLEKVGETFLKDQESVPEREWNTILAFHEAAVTDLRVVVDWYTNAGGAASNAGEHQHIANSDKKDAWLVFRFPISHPAGSTIRSKFGRNEHFFSLFQILNRARTY